MIFRQKNPYEFMNIFWMKMFMKDFKIKKKSQKV